MASTNKYEEAKTQMEEHLQFVAREIGRDWKKLARELKIDRAVIEGIEVEHTTEEERAQMEEHLQFVAREIGRDWRWLGRQLKIGNNVIEGIEEQYTAEDERAYQVLVKWWQDKGFFGATKDILIKALKDIRKTSIAQGIGTCFRSQYVQCSYIVTVVKIQHNTNRQITKLPH